MTAINLALRDRIAASLAQGLSVKDVARLEGLSYQRVYVIIRSMGLVKQSRWKEQEA